MARKPNLEARERILREAEHVLHLKGYSAACMEEIARACGTTKANLFHHYGSKEELALAVLDFKIAEFRSRRVTPLCALDSPQEAVTEMFEDAARRFGRNGCKAGCFVGNFALEMSDQSEAFRGRVSRFFKEWTSGMAACLERRKAAGDFGAAFDARAAAESIAALYEGAVMLARAQRDPRIFRRVGAVARSILETHQTAQRRK